MPVQQSAMLEHGLMGGGTMTEEQFERDALASAARHAPSAQRYEALMDVIRNRMTNRALRRA